MSSNSKKVAIFFLGLFAAVTIKAQWVTNTAINTLVAAQQTEDVQSVRGSDGYTYIAFWHNMPAPQYYELRLQKLDTNGARMFGPNGMLVDGSIAMSSFIVSWDIAITDSNQIFIGITGTGGGNLAVVHKISSSGTKLWGVNGVTIGSGYDVKILPLSNGQVILSYYNGILSTIRKYSATGAPLWAGPITLSPVNAGSKTITGEMIEILGNKFEIIYFEQAGFSPYGLPYARCFGFGGGSIWNNPLALTNGVYIQTNRRYSICKNQDTVYFGYAGSVGQNIQGYIQRINPNGTLPWGINAVDFAIQSTMYERDVRIAADENTAAIWAIAEFTQSNQANVGEYVQKFNRTTGARLLGTNAQAVFPVGPLNRSHHGELRLFEGAPVFLVTDGLSNGVFPKDILLIKLDSTGILSPTTGIIPMATNQVGVKTRISLMDISSNDAVAVWAEDRGTPLPYAHRLSLLPCSVPVSSFNASTNGLSVDFTSTGTAADSVYWEFGDGNSTSDTAALVSHTFTASGTYTVCRIAFSACGNDTMCQNITVCHSLTAQFLYFVYADSVLFINSWNLGDSLYWDFGDGSSASASGNTAWHTYAANGTYLVTLSAFNACGSKTTQQSVLVMGIDINEPLLNNTSIQVWPNPASHILNVSSYNKSKPDNPIVAIYNMSGKCMFIKQLDSLNQNKTQPLDISSLAAGIYLLKLSWLEKPIRLVINR